MMCNSFCTWYGILEELKNNAEKEKPFIIVVTAHRDKQPPSQTHIVCTKHPVSFACCFLVLMSSIVSP